MTTPTESDRRDSTSPVSQAKTPKRRATRQRQESILDELERTFLAEGFAELTMDDMSQKAGCSKATLYGVASSREQLVTLTIRRFVDRAVERIEEAVAGHETARGRTDAYLEAIGTQLAPMSRACYEDIRAFRPTDEIYHQTGIQSAKRVQRLIKDGVDSGEFGDVHESFFGEVVALIIDGILSRRFLDNVGLSDGESYAEMRRMILKVCTTD